MIGRFARGLGERPLAPVAAGAILFAFGAWNAVDLLAPAYPEATALENVDATAIDAIEVVRRRGAVVRYLTGDSLEFQAALDPGEILVLYRDDMPGYEAVKAAIVAGPARYGLWPDAPVVEDRHRIWSLAAADGTVVVSRDATVAGLKASRRDAALMPGLVSLFGLLLTLWGLRSWRAMARREA